MTENALTPFPEGKLPCPVTKVDGKRWEKVQVLLTYIIVFKL